MRGETQKCSEGQFFHPEGGECQDKLPEVVVEAGTILSFKQHLDSFMGKRDMGQIQAIETSLVVKKKGAA